MKGTKKIQLREKRKARVRGKISGTEMRPRVYVFKSDRYLYVGASNDESGKVIAYTRATSKDAKSAEELGKKFADQLKKLKVNSVVFDRSGYRYHGNIKILCEAMRSSGIEF